ncbi:sugar transferase, partial [Peptostreptococcus porci]
MSFCEYSGEDPILKEYIERIDYSIVRKGKIFDLYQRFFDILLSFIGLLIGVPIILIFGMLIKIEDRGPILYKQERLGKHGREFYVYKLRSMRTD